MSAEAEYRTSGRFEPMYDAPAWGFLVFDISGRIMTVTEVFHDDMPADGRRSQRASHDKAYTELYRIEGNLWRTEVYAASLDGWYGSIQERSFRIESDRMQVCSAWCASAIHGGETVRAWFVWERPKAISDWLS